MFYVGINNPKNNERDIYEIFSGIIWCYLKIS
ncbi:hypothetical protein AE07_00441 [Enterobacter cloacae BWH 43]|nr:hypothetical protein AE07_00441 [Enterobacter cloacae BWH 43]